MFSVSLRFQKVQSWVVDRVTGYLSSELNTTVHIGGVRFVLIKSVYLDDVFIADQQEDTLLYAKHLTATVAFQSLFIRNKKLILDEVQLDKARIALSKSKSTRDMNFDFIVNYFSSPSKDTTASPFYFAVNRVILSNIHFTYRDFKWDDKTPCIDFEDIDVSDFSANLYNLKPTDSSFSFYGSKISLKEKSGFKINSFSTYAAFYNDSMSFNKVLIRTPYSSIDAGHYSMSYNSITDFGDYINKVMMKGEFNESIISSNDIQYFAEELFGLDKRVEFSGTARGTVSNLKTKKLKIAYGKNTRFEGDVSLNGLPDVNTTFINLNIKHLSTDKADIESIKQYPFTEQQYIKVPDNISELGKIVYRGVFTGFYNDFVSYGNITTAIGNLSTDVNLKFKNKADESTYSGKLTADNFDIGKFWRLGNAVGTISFNAQLNGTGFTSEKVNARMTGMVSHVNLNGYDYSNINLDADVARKLFNGALNMIDRNAQVSFKGSIDFREKKPLFDFNAIVKNAALTKLNLIKRDTSALLSTEANLNMRGFNFDEFEGKLLLKNINYSEEFKSAFVEKILVQSGMENNNRNFNVNSDLLDLNINGQYILSKIIYSFGHVLNCHLPPFMLKLAPDIEKTNTIFSFDGKIKNVNSVLNIFTPGLSVSNQTVFSGRLNRQHCEIEMEATSPWINYNNIENKNIKLTSNNKNNLLNIDLSASQIKISDSLILKNILFDAETQKNKSSISLTVANDSLSTSKVRLATEQTYTNGATRFHLLESLLQFKGEKWQVDPSNEILFDSASISFSNVLFTNKSQSLMLQGKVSHNKEDVLILNLFKFKIPLLNDLLAMYDIKTGGAASGTLNFSSLYQTAIITGEMRVDSFAFNDESLGNAIVSFDWLTDQKKLHIEGAIEQNNRNSAVVKGDYIFKPKNDELSFNIKFDKLSIAPLERYLKGFASKITGLATGELNLTGLAKAPNLTGKARLQRASMLIDYLNTRYAILPEQDIVFDEKYIAFNNVGITDDQNHKGSVDGKIFHNHFTDFTFSLKVDAKKLQCLNTNASQNELFYGKAFATGYAKIIGTLNLLKLDVVARSEAGTQIFIPLSNPEEVTQSSFITFINVNDTATKHVVINNKVDLTGIQMDLQLEATPDAEIQLIFDSKVGDVMRGNGTGNLRMLISQAGDFSMYGDYNILAGDYLFTLQNIVNKRFKIQSGQIQWAGSPYDATININAKYNLRASTFDLIPDSSNRSRVPVEVLLQLKNNLMSPDVVFNVNVPNATPAVRTSLSSILGNEREMNRQVFSLLVLNRFSPPEGKNTSEESGSGNAVGQNLSEFVSQQLSNWASQLSDKFNIGLNYRPGDALNKDEFDVSISTELFRNRVAVESNVGVANNSNQTSSIIGDFQVEFKISKDGNLRAKAFNKTNTNNLINNLNSQYTQGIGVFYRKEFNTVSDLVETFRKRNKKAAPN